MGTVYRNSMVNKDGLSEAAKHKREERGGIIYRLPPYASVNTNILRYRWLFPEMTAWYSNPGSDHF